MRSVVLLQSKVELVKEFCDDKSLPKAERKRQQATHAPHLTDGAKQIKLADKISNIKDIADAPPADWSQERKAAYVNWAEGVVAGLRGCNSELEKLFDEMINHARSKLD